MQEDRIIRNILILKVTGEGISEPSLVSVCEEKSQKNQDKEGWSSGRNDKDNVLYYHSPGLSLQIRSDACFKDTRDEKGWKAFLEHEDITAVTAKNTLIIFEVDSDVTLKQCEKKFFTDFKFPDFTDKHIDLDDTFKLPSLLLNIFTKILIVNSPGGQPIELYREDVGTLEKKLSTKHTLVLQSADNLAPLYNVLRFNNLGIDKINFKALNFANAVLPKKPKSRKEKRLAKLLNLKLRRQKKAREETSPPSHNEITKKQPVDLTRSQIKLLENGVKITESGKFNTVYAGNALPKLMPQFEKEHERTSTDLDSQQFSTGSQIKRQNDLSTMAVNNQVAVDDKFSIEKDNPSNQSSISSESSHPLEKERINATNSADDYRDETDEEQSDISTSTFSEDSEADRHLGSETKSEFTKKGFTQTEGTGKSIDSIIQLEPRDITRKIFPANAYGQIPVKIVLAGSSEAGKSALLLRACENIYSRDYETTIGVDFKISTVDGVKFSIWDTSGRERFADLTKSYYHKVYALVYVVDGTVPYEGKDGNNERMENFLDTFSDALDENTRRILVVNKADQDKQLNEKEIMALATALGAECIHTQVSVKTGMGVSEIFDDLKERVEQDALTSGSSPINYDLNSEENSDEHANASKVVRREIRHRKFRKAKSAFKGLFVAALLLGPPLLVGGVLVALVAAAIIPAFIAGSALFTALTLGGGGAAIAFAAALTLLLIVVVAGLCIRHRNHKRSLDSWADDSERKNTELGELGELSAASVHDIPSIGLKNTEHPANAFSRNNSTTASVDDELENALSTDTQVVKQSQV